MMTGSIFNPDTEQSSPDRTSKQQQQRPRRIPPIIHQAWMLRPTTLEFPELARMVSRWRSITGYQHYFYTQNEEIEFIQKHYPHIILECYQKITKRLHKREFFILLVLYKIGGIYVGGEFSL
jgi:mannosyltransferase OCH1-like enzyme